MTRKAELYRELTFEPDAGGPELREWLAKLIASRQRAGPATPPKESAPNDDR